MRLIRRRATSVARTAETPRLKGMAVIPTAARRAAAVRELIRLAWSAPSKGRDR